MTGNMCGDRSGEVLMVQPDSVRSPVRIVIMTQSDMWRYNIGVQQITCDQVQTEKMKYLNDYSDCGHKNPR